MHEIFERVTIRNHKSFLPHGAIYKTTRDILSVADVWAFDTYTCRVYLCGWSCAAPVSAP